MQLIIDTRGTYVKKRNNCFFIKNETNERIISPERVSSIAITQVCMLSSAAIELAIKNQLPIYILDPYGDIVGTFWTAQLSHYNNLRRSQILKLEFDSFRIDWMKVIFDGKTMHQIRTLKQLSKTHGNKAETDQVITEILLLLEKIKCIEESDFEICRSTLMGLEGSIARKYWDCISGWLPEKMKFEIRSRRPALDTFNALLNYSYGVLYRVVEQGIFSAGLDPTFGFMHRDQEDSPSLSYDLIEIFRPWLDYELTEWCIKGEFNETSALKDEKLGFIIEKEYKRKIISFVNDILEQEHELDNKIMSFRKHIFRFAELFSSSIREVETNKDQVNA